MNNLFTPYSDYLITNRVVYTDVEDPTIYHDSSPRSYGITRANKRH